MRQPEVLRLAAFTTDPAGGNPAGVVLDARALDPPGMQAIAAEVGYSETAFVTGLREQDGELDVRYFSPVAEVPFCGHATIATGVAWAERHGYGDLRLHTPSGLVEVEVTPSEDGPVATLTSVSPRTEPVDADDLTDVLAALGWAPGDLDPTWPVRVAYAGAHHLVLATRSRERLARLDYDFDWLKALMDRLSWTTLQLVFRSGPREFHARDPFPPGGVVEDPATGAAAAALGGYLREHRLIDVPAEIVIHQGSEIGRPSRITVEIPVAGGIRVSGNAVVMPAPHAG